MKKLNLVLVSLVICLLSTTAIILITNFAAKADLKDHVVRVTKKIEAGKPIEMDSVKVDKMSKDWLSGVSYVRSLDKLKDVYAKETLYPGDIIRVERVGRKNQLTQKEVQPGYERISVELKKPFNAVNYQYRTGETVALNCVAEYEIVRHLNSTYRKDILSVIPLSAGDDTETKSRGIEAVVRVVPKVKIVTFCDKEGVAISDEERQNESNKEIESVTIDVDRTDAFIIQLLRNNKGVFEITKLPEDTGEAKEGE